jgi:hypothetical protein
MPVADHTAGVTIFFSNEGDPPEPGHVHLRGAGHVWWRPARREFRTLGVNTSATAIRFDDNRLWVDLSDGRTLGVPLAWFPRLLHGTPGQRNQWEMSGGGEGLHWDELDEDISVPALLQGRSDQTRSEAARRHSAEPASHAAE